MQKHAAIYLQEHGKGRMNSSAEQGDACALVCSQQQRCLGIPAKAQLQESSHDYCEKAAPAKAEQQPADASMLSRVSSCPLPETPQQEAPQLVLPKLRIGKDSSSKPSAGTPGAAAAGEAAAAGTGQCPGWFFNCRGCGCMTAYERRITTADVPFCRRCQVLLDDATPEMKDKMVSTLLYVHGAWAKAGL
ncbi:hypothetical protein OEZ85_009310 [Tetradesmus obliquus]|uniref:Uncharacterized protein n=1 Tax=Tetradesmus obliquus TaxID=3088 RepID=A0ABY8UAZ6_TETOB|nr:hypothetical protein OEZ85_009310 [Tetradesmus obliquus]